MRLDRYLANNSPLSRSEARTAVRAGRVRIADHCCRDAGMLLTEGALVTLDGCPISPQHARYLMLHKPEDVVCSTQDGAHRTVLDLLPEPLRSGVHVVGRLDRDTTGLVLLTDDGEWTHRVISPKKHCDKRYRVDIEHPLDDEAKLMLEQGVLLRGEERKTLPAQIVICAPLQLRLTIHEGRYHQVKRMLAAVGNRVTALHREAVGGIELDAALQPGEYRALRSDEIAAI